MNKKSNLPKPAPPPAPPKYKLYALNVNLDAVDINVKLHNVESYMTKKDNVKKIKRHNPFNSIINKIGKDKLEEGKKLQEELRLLREKEREIVERLKEWKESINK